MEHGKLYIIGNGFDLQYGIPSRYKQFKAFVENHDRGQLQTIERYLPVDEDWGELEAALAEIGVESIIDDLEPFMASYGTDDWSDSGHYDFQYEVDRVVRSLSVELRQSFGQWIRQLPIPISETSPIHLQTIDPTAQFLSFNYTPTLQQLYGVSDSHVLQIHGRAALEDAELVLGHARNPEEVPSLNDRPNIQTLDTRLIEGNSILDRYFSATFKPAARLIRENRSFFDQLSNVKEAYVLGHSLHMVDAPYYRALLALPGLASARWKIACYEEDDFDTMPMKLEILGVSADRIATCSWSDV
jgi:hypothetical protein